MSSISLQTMCPMICRETHMKIETQLAQTFITRHTSWQTTESHVVSQRETGKVNPQSSKPVLRADILPQDSVVTTFRTRSSHANHLVPRLPFLPWFSHSAKYSNPISCSKTQAFLPVFSRCTDRSHRTAQRLDIRYSSVRVPALLYFKKRSIILFLRVSHR